MLHKTEPNGLILISQPAHSWLSGQIARQWGNADFEAPSEDVCLAAELHDIGFLCWEESPTLNPETGLPHDFLNMPPKLHMELWTEGVRHLLRFGRYPALLVSLHFTSIIRQNWVSRKKDHLVKDYLEEQDAFQKTIITSLQNDFFYGASVSPESAVRDQQLISVLDWISLLACLGLREERTIPEVPWRHGKTPMKVTPLDSEGRRLKLEPWPLRVPDLRLVCEGRRLLKTYSDQDTMRDAIRAAARVTVLADLSTT